MPSLLKARVEDLGRLRLSAGYILEVLGEELDSVASPGTCMPGTPVSFHIEDNERQSCLWLSVGLAFPSWPDLNRIGQSLPRALKGRSHRAQINNC